ncbi:hypothetical protein HMPREF0972_01726 [Actinomyces sp. oral taxon 848 str. F0332]|nr:hypothetical protein HMPREF0972_01726 [Actinomyces sp. oral taxon 848 str. F0332]
MGSVASSLKQGIWTKTFTVASHACLSDQPPRIAFTTAPCAGRRSGDAPVGSPESDRLFV